MHVRWWSLSVLPLAPDSCVSASYSHLRKILCSPMVLVMISPTKCFEINCCCLWRLSGDKTRILNLCIWTHQLSVMSLPALLSQTSKNSSNKENWINQEALHYTQSCVFAVAALKLIEDLTAFRGILSHLCLPVHHLHYLHSTVAGFSAVWLIYRWI